MLSNNSSRPLLLLAGEIVTGGKQDRVIGADRIVPPNTGPIDLAVFCVEPGRWVEFKVFRGMASISAVRDRLDLEEADPRELAAIGAEGSVELHRLMTFATAPRDPTQHTLRAVPGLPGDWLFPAIDLNGMPVRGFTYRLGTDWLGLLSGQNPIEQAGFEVACRVLDFLLSHGLEPKSGWEACIEQPAIGEPQTAKVATPAVASRCQQWPVITSN